MSDEIESILKKAVIDGLLVRSCYDKVIVGIGFTINRKMFFSIC